MLRLSLLRHAKSNWDEPDLADHERQLTKRGTEAAALMARYIAGHKLIPKLILCSDAIRTRATLALMLAEWPKPHPQVIITSDLYLAPPAAILKAVTEHADKIKHVMVIGHNPGLHALALSLPAMAKSKSDLARLAIKYPTAALTHLTFDKNDWSQIGPASGFLECLVTPRDLADC